MLGVSYEPLRKFRWILGIDGIDAYTLKTAARPQLTFDEIVIDYINTTINSNIISLEDPIEFVHASKRSQIVQRELGTHIPSFAEGVRASLREDPDVILVGELRDGETINMAITGRITPQPM